MNGKSKNILIGLLLLVILFLTWLLFNLDAGRYCKPLPSGNQDILYNQPGNTDTAGR